MRLTHGTPTRYRLLCRCPACRGGWAKYMADYRARKQTTVAYQDKQQGLARTADKDSGQ